MFNRGLTLIFRKVDALNLPQSCAIRSANSASATRTDHAPKCSSSLFFPRRAYAKKVQPVQKNNKPIIVPLVEPVPKAPSNSEILTKFIPYEERTITWDYAGQGQSNTLPFRVTYYGIDGFDAEASSRWKISSETIIAPFFNQEEVLLDMLRSLYFNSTRGSLKPEYAIQIASPGSGKTRMLSEWIMQAFANRKVIGDFFADEYVDDQSRHRKQFLNTVYRSVYKQHTIISSGSSWRTKDQSVASLQASFNDVVCKTILERHNGQSIKFRGKDIVVNAEAANNSFGIGHLSLAEPVKLFIALADVTYDDPKQLPFPEEGLLPGKGNVFFCIDECQMIGENFRSTTKPDVLHELILHAAAESHDGLESGNGISPFWFAVGTNLNGKFFTVEEHHQFRIRMASLSNLLDITYLAQLCKQFLKHKLPSTYYNDTSDLPEISDIATKVLVRNFLKTFGNPRGVRLFIYAAITYFSNLSALSPNGLKKTISLFEAQVDKELLSVYRPTTLQGTPESIEKLNTAAAMCAEVPYEESIRGLKVLAKSLVTRGYLSVWKREPPRTLINGQARFCLTRPFFNMTADEMKKPIASKVFDTEHWTPYNISLASLVLERDFATHYMDSNVKGASFEMAVASSLYARYSIVAKPNKEVQLHSVFPAKEIPDSLRNATVRLNGVVLLKDKVNVTSRKVFEEIIKQKVVAVDVQNSEFASVLLPVTLTGLTSIICFQYRVEEVPSLVSNCEEVVGRGFYFVGITPTQNDNTKFVSMLSESSQNFGFLAEASEVVSPLYLIGKTFVPQETTSKKVN